MLYNCINKYLGSVDEELYMFVYLDSHIDIELDQIVDYLDKIEEQMHIEIYKYKFLSPILKV